MSNMFEEFLNIVSDDELEENPVSIEEFVQSDEFLKLPPLSHYQYLCINMSTQIYRRETLEKFLKPAHADARWKQTKNEVILQLGKGSGKDFMSTISCAYVVYLLLCLKDPAAYYGKPSGDNIDIINVAMNSDQATRVFFKGVVGRIKKSPWFQGKYEAKSNGDPARDNEIKFIKNVNLYSGHSEREAFEGYNTIFVFLDEIAGFAVDGGTVKNTADEVYKTYRASITSRFPEFGKLILASFPRFKGDFITKRYDAVVAENSPKKCSYTFKLDPDLPDGIRVNEYTVEWEEDNIIRYTEPKVFALRRPSWEVNPIMKIDDYVRDFITDPQDALGRFACMPPDSISGMFKSKERLESLFKNGYPTEDGNSVRFKEPFVPLPNTEYFIHVDLAQTSDMCVVAMTHVEKWVSMPIAKEVYETVPVINVDAIRWWKPSSTETVDFNQVKNYIFNLKRTGFNIRKVTYDRWNSVDMIKAMRSVGIESEILSVAYPHYQDLMFLVNEDRIYGPRQDKLITELLQLQLTKGRVDHPVSGSKDIADAVTGAAYNAIKLSLPDLEAEIEVQDYKSVMRESIEEARQRDGRGGSIIAPGMKGHSEYIHDYDDWVVEVDII